MINSACLNLTLISIEDFTMAVCKANMLFVILTSYTVLLNQCANTNELLMQTFSKVLLLDTRMDNIEIKFDTEFRKSLTDIISLDEKMDTLEIKIENSLTDLQTQLAEGLERIAETQKNCEPKQGGITKRIQSTNPNNVTQMVKSQYSAINTAMKREKVALRNLKNKMNKHMKTIDNEFQNIQRTIEVRFLNQSIAIEEHIRAQKENVSDVMNDVIIETNAHANQLKIDFENAQSSLDESFTNQTKDLDSKFERQSDDIDEFIRDLRNEREQLKGNFGDVQKSLNNAIDDIKEETKKTTFNLQQTLNEKLETMQSEVNLRFINQEDIILSLNSTIGSTEESLQDYKSSSDSISADLSSLDYRFEKQSDEFREFQTNQENKTSSLNSRMSSTEGSLQSYNSSCDVIRLDVSNLETRVSSIEKVLSAFPDCWEIRQNLGTMPSGVYHITTWKTNQTASVFCDMDTDQGGWTVFQHRVDGSVDFYRNFSSYENMFGSLQGEFWLGLKMMHEMTSRKTHDLRIDITHADDSTAFSVYAGFSVGAGSNYTLHVRDALSERGLAVFPSWSRQFNTYANGSAFTTFDHDNDDWPARNCAVEHRGAWWYQRCTYLSNLNGLYYRPGTVDSSRWAMIYDGYESLKTSNMMFRPSV
ncbi:fibrinogen C domain-containing protein 1-B-like isoform X3 [Mya arenaria]|uniref:fibrinogen C domain-containing protein 1-B-like isoform X3 n=1 Tax=Mya arenaria TaxID=6604 RepID=UPI0022E2860D|nr:fibrinogen C domain-containing protein 1-B-like isoform X3 [Mya arenaria]